MVKNKEIAEEAYDQQIRRIICAIGIQAVEDFCSMRRINVIRKDGTVNPCINWNKKQHDYKTGKVYNGCRRFKDMNRHEIICLQQFMYSSAFEKVLECGGIMVSAEDVRKRLLNAPVCATDIQTCKRQ